MAYLTDWFIPINQQRLSFYLASNVELVEIFVCESTELG